MEIVALSSASGPWICVDGDVLYSLYRVISNPDWMLYTDPKQLWLLFADSPVVLQHSAKNTHALPTPPKIAFHRSLHHCTMQLRKRARASSLSPSSLPQISTRAPASRRDAVAWRHLQHAADLERWTAGVVETAL